MLANRHRGEARNHALQERVRSEQTRAAPARSPDEPAATDVWDALAALSERDREALLLVAWEELTPARAARVLGVSANTFAVRVYRARRRFARALAARVRPSRSSAGISDHRGAAMSDRVIDAIRRVDPCPAELPPPPIESVLARLREETESADPADTHERPRQRSRARSRLGLPPRAH